MRSTLVWSEFGLPTAATQLLDFSLDKISLQVVHRPTMRYQSSWTLDMALQATRTREVRPVSPRKMHQATL